MLHRLHASRNHGLVWWPDTCVMSWVERLFGKFVFMKVTKSAVSTRPLSTVAWAEMSWSQLKNANILSFWMGPPIEPPNSFLRLAAMLLRSHTERHSLEIIVGVIFKQRAMELIGAGFGHGLNHESAAVAIFRRVIVHRNVEFRDRIRVGGQVIDARIGIAGGVGIIQVEGVGVPALAVGVGLPAIDQAEDVVVKGAARARP